jgi:hypothetical protein
MMRVTKLYPVFIPVAIGLIWIYRDLESYVTNFEGGYISIPPTKNFWEMRESSCIHVDDVCSRGKGWFYGPTGHQTTHQPTISLDQDWTVIRSTHTGIKIDQRIQFDVSSTSHGQYDDSSCSFLPVPNHLVAQSAYNEMMGEFYSRSLLGLNRWMRDFPTLSSEEIQIYVHFVDRRKERLLEGHKLFLRGLPNNGIFDSLVSLMPKNDTCLCYKKLIFCGYVVKNAVPVADNDTRVFISSRLDDP